MARITWNTENFQAACISVTMDRLEAAANIIAEDAKAILSGKIQGNWREHGPYKRRYVTDKSASRIAGKRIRYIVPYTTGQGDSWTARHHGDMIKTIRVVRKNDATTRNVWIMAGHYNTWWAMQLEYGRGNWRGKGKPFLRRAMAGATTKIKAVIEGGAVTETEL